MTEKKESFLDGCYEYTIYTGHYRMALTGAERIYDHPLLGRVSNTYHIDPKVWGRNLLIIGEFYDFQLVKWRKLQGPNGNFLPWKRTAVPIAKFETIR